MLVQQCVQVGGLEAADPLPDDGDMPLGAVELQGGREVEVATSGLLRRGGRLWTLAVATEAMAALSGFETHEVTNWLLTGTAPSLVRASVGGSFVLRHRPEPESSAADTDAEHPTIAGPKRKNGVFRSPRVTVEFFTSDIRNEDLRELRKRIDQEWARLGDAMDPRATLRRQAREDARRAFRSEGWKISGLPTPGPARPSRGRLTTKDLQLRAAVDELGGVPEKPTAAFWEEVRRRCKEEGCGSVQASSLRRRWKRIQSKPRPTGPVAKRRDRT